MGNTSGIMNVVGGLYSGYAYESVTIDSTAGGVGLTSTKYLPGNTDANTSRAAVRVVMTLETAQIRYTYDGTAPTSSEGHLVNAGDSIVLIGDDPIRLFRGIRTGGSSGTLKVTYER